MKKRWISMEIILYSNLGEPQAFIDSDEGDFIYDLQGRAVSYIYNDDLVYNFKGQHLGWLEEDVLYDLDGQIVGSFESKCKCIPTKEMIGSLRENNQELEARQEPINKPKFTKTESYEDLISFLKLTN